MRSERKGMKPTDIVVLILAGTLAIIQIMVIIGALISGEPMTDKGAEIMGDLVLGEVAIISYYIGNRTKK